MKKTIIIAAALLLCSSAFLRSQDSPEAFKERYDRQVRIVGAAGLGVQGILDRWEAAFPEDASVHEARYKYWIAKSHSTDVVPMQREKYLGAEPVLTLKDSTGLDVHYFEKNLFADSLYTEAMIALDRAIALEPEELAYRIDKVTSLMLYGGENQELVSRELLGLIELDRKSSPSWTYYGDPVADGTFVATVQEYCWNLFRYGTPSSYEAFRQVSEAMLKINPKDTDFLNNLGSYYLVCKDNPRQALKWYNKVLKIAPDDYNAAKNCVVVARKAKNVKLEKKYLPMLIKASDSDSEMAACEMRLKALENKKK